MHRRRSLTRRSLVAVLLVAAVLLAPAVAGGASTDTRYGQQGTATTGTGTAGNATSGGGGGPLSLVTGALGAVGGFLFGTTVGNALVGIPLGLYLGLKAIAIYLEYYE